MDHVWNNFSPCFLAPTSPFSVQNLMTWQTRRLGFFNFCQQARASRIALALDGTALICGMFLFFVVFWFWLVANCRLLGWWFGILGVHRYTQVAIPFIKGSPGIQATGDPNHQLTSSWLMDSTFWQSNLEGNQKKWGRRTFWYKNQLLYTTHRISVCYMYIPSSLPF